MTEKHIDRDAKYYLFGARVTDLRLNHGAQGYGVDCIFLDRQGKPEEIHLNREDAVIVTLGSITESSSLGTMETAPVLQIDPDAGAWALWKSSLADKKTAAIPPTSSITSVNQSGYPSLLRSTIRRD